MRDRNCTAARRALFLSQSLAGTSPDAWSTARFGVVPTVGSAAWAAVVRTLSIRVSRWSWLVDITSSLAGFTAGWVRPGYQTLALYVTTGTT